MTKVINLRDFSQSNLGETLVTLLLTLVCGHEEESK